MLGELLTVKRRREDDAVAAVAEARRALGRERDACQARERELGEFETWQAAERERLDAALFHKHVTRDRLDEHRERIAALRQRHLELEEQLERARKAAADAEEALEQARRKRLDAHREVVKFEEYERRLEEERRRATERREEEEAEDVLSGRFRNGDGFMARPGGER